MTGKERIQTVLSHREADRIALDFGATTVTGIHVKMIAEFRRYYGLEDKPVKVIEPFQMLGEVDELQTSEERVSAILRWFRVSI